MILLFASDVPWGVRLVNFEGGQLHYGHVSYLFKQYWIVRFIFRPSQTCNCMNKFVTESSFPWHRSTSRRESRGGDQLQATVTVAPPWDCPHAHCDANHIALTPHWPQALTTWLEILRRPWSPEGGRPGRLTHYCVVWNQLPLTVCVSLHPNLSALAILSGAWVCLAVLSEYLVNTRWIPVNTSRYPVSTS